MVAVEHGAHVDNDRFADFNRAVTGIVLDGTFNCSTEFARRAIARQAPGAVLNIGATYRKMVQNLAWAAGFSIGAIAGGSLAEATTDAVAYNGVALLYGASAVVAIFASRGRIADTGELARG